ncbi:MAG: LemA family protein [Bacteroidales bacterium]|nr:LemA family protein [Bacteroidales bacterium]
MKKIYIVLIGIVAVIGLAIVWGIGVRNKLVGLDEQSAEKWSQVESAYQRRSDLIGNLVKTVQGAADFEKGTFTEVTNARANAGSVKLNPDELTEENIAAYQAAQDRLGSALNRAITVTVENYPQLTATQNFKDLQTQLEGTENRINVARQNFNEAVRHYNTAIRRFPNSIVANMSGFDKKGYFKSAEGAENAPEVEFNF